MITNNFGQYMTMNHETWSFKRKGKKTMEVTLEYNQRWSEYIHVP